MNIVSHNKKIIMRWIVFEENTGRVEAEKQEQ